MDGYDLLIVGGGVHGIAVAYEAARRGRTFALVDRADLGGGASSSSLKILHGGLRYLQSMDLRRSRESVAARRRLMRLMPSLVAPLRCRLDLEGRALPYRLMFRAGLLLNDLLTADRNRGLPEGVAIPGSSYPCWYDAVSLNTERMMFALLDAALERTGGESALFSHTSVTPVPDGDGWRGRLHDELNERPDRELRARMLVRCTGAHESETGAGVSINLVVEPLAVTGAGEAVALSHPLDGRNVFLVPWRGVTLVGTWDREYPDAPASPFRFDPGWIDEMLEWLAPVHPELAALTRERVRLVHAGLLPLTPDGRALLEHPKVARSGTAVDVLGVKYTTALGVAANAMSHVDDVLGPPASRVPEETPLADPAETLASFLAGSETRGEPLAGGEGVTRGEVERAVRVEAGRTLADVMFRRLDVAATGYPGESLTHAVAGEMATLLGWSPSRLTSEVASFVEDWRFAGNAAVTGRRP